MEIGKIVKAYKGMLILKSGALTAGNRGQFERRSRIKGTRQVEHNEVVTKKASEAGGLLGFRLRN